MAHSSERARLDTNQAYVEEVQQTTKLMVNDPLEVFAFVLGSLPERTRVYPTENYYYFRFLNGGIPYAGSIRLDAMDRDQGKVHFGYFQALSEWNVKAGIDKYVVLDTSHGVEVTRLERLVYRISYGTNSVVFALNDLSGVKPLPTAIGPDENFLGPIFDESGIRFFFVYNMKLKIFHFILDETVKVAEEFYASARTNRIVVGRRTGFSFYRDHRLTRKILIGAYEGNSRVNNYFDGPFDQLPENFIEGEELREAIYAADPDVRDRIDRLGHYISGKGRYLVHPYMLYLNEGDLYRIHTCASSRERLSNYNRCFVVSPQGKVDPDGEPVGLKRR